MRTEFAKPFEKDVDKIVDPALIDDIEQVIRNVENAQTITGIHELRKLVGYKQGKFYRIRVGSYRLGITIVGNLVTFARCLPRNIFYRKFP